jgi:hypothetical protein
MTSMGLSAFAMAVPAVAPSTSFATELPGAGLWVVDKRITDPSREAGRDGVPVVNLDGDVSAAWHNAIRPHIQANRTPIAGYTQEDALFCLQQLAADHRWRLQRCVDVTQGQDTPAVCLSTRSNSISWLLVPHSVA